MHKQKASAHRRLASTPEIANEHQKAVYHKDVHEEKVQTVIARHHQRGLQCHLQDLLDGHLRDKEAHPKVHQLHCLQRSQHHFCLRRPQCHRREVAHVIEANIQGVAHIIIMIKDIQQKISYICNFLLDIFSIFFMIIIAQMVKTASELIIRRRLSQHQPSGSTFATSMCLCSLLHPEPCHSQQMHLLNIHHCNIQPQHPQFHLHHLSLVYVHHECAYIQLQLPEDNPSLLYHPAFIYTIAIEYIDTVILHYLSQTSI